MVPSLPYLAPWYRVATTKDQVVLEYGQRIVCLTGRAGAVLMPVLLPLLDGTRTFDEIVEVLGRPVQPAVEAALERLAEHDLLLDGPPLADDVPLPVSATSELLATQRPGELEPRDVAASLGSSCVAVVGSGPSAVEVGRQLAQSGVLVRRDETLSGRADLVVCVPAPTQLPALVQWNRQALALRQTWLQVLPFDGRYAAVGPLYLPHETCCFECFRLRRLANLDAVQEFELLEEVPATYPASPSLQALVAAIATTVVLQWLVLRDHHAPSAYYAIELGHVLGVRVHHVHRVPRCPACSGIGEVAAPLPWHKEQAVVGC